MKPIRLALLCAGALAGPLALASPDLDDPLLRLLGERGVVRADGAFVREVGSGASELAHLALELVGAPYRRGGDGDAGFDCSGFTRHVFERGLGLLLPRRADEQAHAPELFAVRRADLQPGDLVFFDTLQRTFSHVGIYLGAGRFVHAPRPGAQVRVDDIASLYWSARFTGARRAHALGAPGRTTLPSVNP